MAPQQSSSNSGTFWKKARRNSDEGECEKGFEKDMSAADLAEYKKRVAEHKKLRKDLKLSKIEYGKLSSSDVLKKIQSREVVPVIKGEEDSSAHTHNGFLAPFQDAACKLFPVNETVLSYIKNKARQLIPDLLKGGKEVSKYLTERYTEPNTTGANSRYDDWVHQQVAIQKQSNQQKLVFGDVRAGSELASRPLLILILGLPAVGKSTVARELAPLLALQNKQGGKLDGHIPMDGEGNLRWAQRDIRLPVAPETGSSSGAIRPRPIESFGGGKIVVVHINDLSDCLPPNLIRTSQDSHDHLPQYPSTISKIEGARHHALIRYVFPEEFADTTFILTDCLYNDEDGEYAANQYKTCAALSGRLFVPIYLTCDRESHELHRFIQSKHKELEKDRVDEENGKGKENEKIGPTNNGTSHKEDRESFAASSENTAPKKLYRFCAPRRKVSRFIPLRTPAVPTYLGKQVDSTHLNSAETARAVYASIEEIQNGTSSLEMEAWEVDFSDDEAAEGSNTRGPALGSGWTMIGGNLG